MTLSQDLDDLAIRYLATVQAIAVRRSSNISKNKLTIKTFVLSICSAPPVSEMLRNAFGAVSQLEEHLPQRDICLSRQY